MIIFNLRKLLVLIFWIIITSCVFLPSAFAENLSLLMAGDTMLGTEENKISPELFANIQDVLLKPYDIVFFNFEGTMGRHGIDDLNPKCLNGPYCFKFLVPMKALNVFEQLKNKNSHWVFNLANNHSMDYGIQTQLKTFQYLSQNNTVIGTLYKPVQFLNIRDYKIALIGASPHHNTVSIFDPELLKMVKKLKSQGFIVIVSLHMGAEGENEYIVKNQNEYFAGALKGNIYEVAHRLIDSGADVIIGHGPHVMRPLEIYQHKLIAYSLGNFLTYGQFSLTGKTSYGGLLNIEINKQGDFIKGKFIPTQQLKSSNPKMWEKGIALKYNPDSYLWLKKISQENFSNQTLIFNNEDDILPIK